MEYLPLPAVVKQVLALKDFAIKSKMSGILDEFDVGYLAIDDILYTWKLDVTFETVQ
jgi:hypothetical protein